MNNLPRMSETMEKVIQTFCTHHSIKERIDEQIRAYHNPRSIVIILDFAYSPKNITQLYGHDVFYANIPVPVLIGTRAIKNSFKYQSQTGYCPMCLTEQDMLENQSCCTECGEPLEEGEMEE